MGNSALGFAPPDPNLSYEERVAKEEERFRLKREQFRADMETRSMKGQPIRYNKGPRKLYVPTHEEELVLTDCKVLFIRRALFYSSISTIPLSYFMFFKRPSTWNQVNLPIKIGLAGACLSIGVSAAFLRVLPECFDRVLALPSGSELRSNAQQFARQFNPEANRRMRDSVVKKSVAQHEQQYQQYQQQQKKE